MFQSLLALLLATTVCYSNRVHAQNIDECSTCLMPCFVSDPSINKTSLIRAYAASYKEYRITTLLNGIQGHFLTTVSLDDTESFVYSARVDVEKWPFSTLCKILTDTLNVTENNQETINVNFPNLPSFVAYRNKDDDRLQDLLIEKVAELQNVADRTPSWEAIAKLEMQMKLKYAISNSTYSGKAITCQSPNPIRIPTGDRYCWTATGNWFNFQLGGVFTINLIRFRLYDLDGRTYTYSIEVSLDNVNWMDAAVQKSGQSIQELKLSQPVNISYVRMDGYNTADTNLHFMFVTLDWI